MWTPSNTWMPGVTPLTTRNDSSIAAHTSAQLRNKVPIGYNGMPQIHPENCPFPFDDNHPHLIHISLDQPHSSSQMASGFNQPFCQNILCDLTHRPKDRWSRRMFRNISAPLAMLIESDALIIWLIKLSILYTTTTLYLTISAYLLQWYASVVLCAFHKPVY